LPDAPPHTSRYSLSLLGLVWGLVGLFGSLVEAVVRLLPLALEPLREGMTPGPWAAYVGFVLFNTYAEGYRGFQRAFSPRVAVRAVLLFRAPTPLRLWLAPLFLMGLVDATRRRLIANWLLVGIITVLILVLRRTPQPWRGIVDAGVVTGLVWGTLATAWFLLAAARGRAPEADPELAQPLPNT
jgi:hypothetical protein